MSDREARVLGAEKSLNVEGKVYRIQPLNLKQLAALQIEAVQHYKRAYLKTFKENSDLLPAGSAAAILEKKVDEVARWDLSDIPSKRVYSVTHIPITEDLQVRLQKEMPSHDENDEERTEKQWQRVLQGLLDQGEINADEIERLSGHRPEARNVPYDMWWVTGTYEGMIAIAHCAVNVDGDVDRSEVCCWPIHALFEAAFMAEEVTSPDMGNT